MFSPPCYRRGCSCYLMYSWRTFCYRTALADPGGRPPPPLILEQTEAQTAEKNSPPPHPRKVWVRHWTVTFWNLFGTIFTLNIVNSFRKRVSAKTKLRLPTVRDPFLFSVSCLVSGKNQRKVKPPSRGFTQQIGKSTWFKAPLNHETSF